jgi:hypothetical protein
VISDSWRRSLSIRRPRVYKQMERSGYNSRRAGMVLTENIPCWLCRYEMCEGAGTRIPLGRCGDDGVKGDESDRVFPRSFAFLSPWPCPLSKSYSNTGSSRLTRCFSKLSVCYESRNPSVLALANPDPPPSPSHLIVFVGIATAIRNGTDGLDEPTA